ncbi:MAG: rod shape-determining protein MreD [Bacteroidales bacterium]|nr:rod shape-determining protein MreD [Bacteroidales bacterium]
MIKAVQKYLLLFLILIAAQLLAFDNIEFSGYINPYVYILFVLLLPFEIPRALLLLLAFALGLIIDLFLGTPGVHSSATVLMAFMRPVILVVFAPQDGYQKGTNPRIACYGLEWFVKYAATLVIIHHFTLFYLEVLSLDHFINTLLRILASAAFTLLILVLSQFLVFRK